jgi:hypothetical protein
LKFTNVVRGNFCVNIRFHLVSFSPNQILQVSMILCNILSGKHRPDRLVSRIAKITPGVSDDIPYLTSPPAGERVNKFPSLEGWARGRVALRQGSTLLAVTGAKSIPFSPLCHKPAGR